MLNKIKNYVKAMFLGASTGIYEFYIVHGIDNPFLSNFLKLKAITKTLAFLTLASALSYGFAIFIPFIVTVVGLEFLYLSTKLCQNRPVTDKGIQDLLTALLLIGIFCFVGAFAITLLPGSGLPTLLKFLFFLFTLPVISAIVQTAVDFVCNIFASKESDVADTALSLAMLEGMMRTNDQLRAVGEANFHDFRRGSRSFFSAGGYSRFINNNNFVSARPDNAAQSLWDRDEPMFYIGFRSANTPSHVSNSQTVAAALSGRFRQLK